MAASQDFQRIRSLLQLTSTPVAMTFVEQQPAEVPRVAQRAPAACGYWPLAASQSFYTTAEDELGCAVGAFTHGVSLTPPQMEELKSMVGTMLDLQYLQPDEVDRIPHRASFAYCIYEPLDSAQREPDVVIVRGNASQMMLLGEATRAAGSFRDGLSMGRPACAMLPQALASAQAVLSLGCVGNRVYTCLPVDEMYMALPGPQLAEIARRLETIVAANATLRQFHRSRVPVAGGATAGA